MDTGLHPHAALSERAPAGGEGQSPRSGPQSSESQPSAISGVPSTRAVHREGFDFEFVPPLDPQYECPICTLGLRNPSQTKCGHRFCEVCIHTWIRERQSQTRCPSCQTPITASELYPDNFAKREVLASTVLCPNRSQGCSITIQLRRIQEHLENCEFAPIMCPNACSVIVLRKHLSSHLQQNCTNRKTTCPFCKNEYVLSAQQEHLRQCNETRIACTHCQLLFPRNKMESHLLRCPEEIIECPVTRCNQKVKRQHLLQHIHNKVPNHILYVNEAISILAQLLGISSHVFDSSVFRLQRNSLGVNLSDLTSGSESSMSTMNSLLNPSSLDSSTTVSNSLGEAAALPFDMSSLQQLLIPVQDSSDFRMFPSVSVPMSSGVSAQLPQAVADTTLISESVDEMKVTLDKYKKQVTDQEKDMKDLRKKIEHAEAQERKANQRLKKVEEMHRELETRCSGGVYIWYIQNFTEMRTSSRREAQVLHSPAFYSGYYGYKLCIRVNMNGVDSAYGTHLSIFVHFMQGQFDSILDWPFSGKITLSVLDQNENSTRKRHISETLFSKAQLDAFKRPTSHRNHKGFGYLEFVPLSVLENSGSDAVYLRNDTVVIRVKVECNQSENG